MLASLKATLSYKLSEEIPYCLSFVTLKIVGIVSVSVWVGGGGSVIEFRFVRSGVVADLILGGGVEKEAPSFGPTLLGIADS